MAAVSSRNMGLCWRSKWWASYIAIICISSSCSKSPLQPCVLNPWYTHSAATPAIFVLAILSKGESLDAPDGFPHCVDKRQGEIAPGGWTRQGRISSGLRARQVRGNELRDERGAEAREEALAEDLRSQSRGKAKHLLGLQAALQLLKRRNQLLKRRNSALAIRRL
ncbi:hypothetical protein T492DRAFT_1146647 [Pavlovales sp. CCMP2436]|nr:hypothetical protein T492DRAFT_1146647 [Pavlovales sp. CCMP2436]